MARVPYAHGLTVFLPADLHDTTSSKYSFNASNVTVLLYYKISTRDVQ